MCRQLFLVEDSYVNARLTAGETLADENSGFMLCQFLEVHIYSGFRNRVPVTTTEPPYSGTRRKMQVSAMPGRPGSR